MNRREEDPPIRVIPTHMPQPFPGLSNVVAIPENIDPEVAKLIEESSSKAARCAKHLDADLMKNVIIVAMVAAYRCGESEQAKKQLQNAELCRA